MMNKADQIPQALPPATEQQRPEEFYAERIGNFDAERKIFSEYVRIISPSKGELHVLDFEYRQGQDNAAAAIAERENAQQELRKLRKEISMAKEELRALTEGQESRREQIERLSELSQPVQRDTTYLILDRYLSRGEQMQYKGVTVTSAIDLDRLAQASSSEIGGEVSDAHVGTQQGGDSNAARGGKGGGKGNGNGKSPGGSGGSSNSSSSNSSTGIVTSSKHYMKNVRTGDIIQLETRLDEETSKATNGLSKMQTALREVDEGSSRLDVAVTSTLEAARGEASALINEVDRLDYQGFLSVSELLRLRLRIMIAQREEVEELSRLHADKAFFLAKEKQTREQLVADMALMKRRLKAEASNSTRDFQSQHVSLDATLAKLKRRIQNHSQQRKANDAKHENTEQMYLMAKDRYMRLKRRNALEMEGFASEATMLKNRLKQLEKLYVQQNRQGGGGGGAGGIGRFINNRTPR